ncbi:hypothetical protein Xcc3_40110 [Xanthomonas campestris pv. campestris]|nr:hypothetical protein Xcc1_39340 [Xanthomonas campestris pv. campestris]BBK02704.1 hypothetical protein Xcc3_40110 [Xanthomonas campestris pv. campestris]
MEYVSVSAVCSMHALATVFKQTCAADIGTALLCIIRPSCGAASWRAIARIACTLAAWLRSGMSFMRAQASSDPGMRALAAHCHMHVRC